MGCGLFTLRLGLVCILAGFPGFALGADTEGPAAANPAAASELPTVVVIANTPLQGLGLPANEVPSNVQTADSKDMQRQQSLTLADYMSNNFTGLNVSDSAANPFQTDINYHGFTASPLLGTPEGLSVYVDGVRVNEAFGDTVNWDLIPESAISTMTLLSGSNPLFGLNTLGGALSLHTKSGHDDPGTELEGYAGSFGRRAFEGQTGGALGNFDYFLTANDFAETGWRENGESRAVQVFGKVGWENEKSDLDLSYTYADTDLWGDGATPQSMLNYRYEQSYTPDVTENLLNFVNLTGTQFLADKLLLSGNVYYRHLVTSVDNGNINDSYLSTDYVGPPIDCMGSPTNLTTLAYCAIGQNALSRLDQSTRGIGLQLTDSRDLFGWSNQGVLGADFTDSTDAFYQAYVYGPLAANHLLLVEPLAFNNQPVISLGGTDRIYGVYMTDTLSPSKLLHLTAAVRYNSSKETIEGYSVNTDVGPGFNVPVPVGGDHTFARINPSFGFTLTPTDTQTYYANYNEASRAPTVIELGCANPTTPCGLPNDFASDPDLKQVIAHTVEVGARGNLAGDRLIWSGDVYRTVNSDDIQFVATSINAGYFDNVGDTRRQGLDLALGGTAAKLHWRVTYSLVDATFQSRFVVSAPSNSTADAFGNIVVSPGDRIPLIPRDTGRVILDYDVTKRLNVGGNVVFVSGSYLHGDENNANVAGGTNLTGAYVEGTGWLASYTLVNLQGTYHLVDHVELFARIVNALNKRYGTAGFLSSNSFAANGAVLANPNNWTNENAVSPGAPLGIWAGVRANF
jgi:outer membrane receptor protein involved in Fe transport